MKRPRRWTVDDAGIHRTERPETKWERIRAQVKEGIVGGRYDGLISVMEYRRLAFWRYLWKRGKN